MNLIQSSAISTSVINGIFSIFNKFKMKFIDYPSCNYREVTSEQILLNEAREEKVLSIVNRLDAVALGVVDGGPDLVLDLPDGTCITIYQHGSSIYVDHREQPGVDSMMCLYVELE